MFLRFVVDQFSEEVLSQLIRNPDRGVKNLEAATGVAFPDLFRWWTISLAQAEHRISPEDNSSGPFRSIDLTGRIGRWGLQGPRATEWNVNQEGQRFSLIGTTAKVFDVHAAAPGIYRLRVRTQGQPKLQVTIIRKPSDFSPANVLADWQFPESLPMAHTPALHVKIPSDWKVLRLSVECLHGLQGQSYCWEAEQLPGMEIPAPSAGLDQEFVLHPPERLFPLGEKGPASWQLKVLSEDANGRRSAQWIDLPNPNEVHPHGNIPVATTPGPPVL